jgi:hypothetical protein
VPSDTNTDTDTNTNTDTNTDTDTSTLESQVLQLQQEMHEQNLRHAREIEDLKNLIRTSTASNGTTPQPDDARPIPTTTTKLAPPRISQSTPNQDPRVPRTGSMRVVDHAMEATARMAMDALGVALRDILSRDRMDDEYSYDGDFF